MLVLALAVFGCTPLASSWSDEQSFPVREATNPSEIPPDPDGLRVLTWNLKFGGGRIDFFFDGWDDRVHMSEDEVQANLYGLLDLIEEVQPDLLLAQEVDIGSKRSAYVDQVDVLLEGYDGFNYAAWVPVWVSQYVPEEGLGRVEMGQAVFSRYPIERNIRVDLPQSEAQSLVVNYFYMHRAIQVVRLHLGEAGSLNVVNNHPDAYALDGTKEIHLQMILEEARRLPSPVVVGGDLNVVPPGSLQLSDFEDQPEIEGLGVSEVSYTQEETRKLTPLYEDYQAVVPLEAYQVDTLEEQRAFFTHSISAEVFWTQKLDYLFTDQTWAWGATLQAPGDGDPPLVSDPMMLSDHAPMVGDLVLP